MMGRLEAMLPSSLRVNLARDGLVPVRLHEPLRAVRQGEKPLRLMHCRCEVLGATDEPWQASNLNQALQSISERMELHRASHAGNVFTRMLVPCDPRANGHLLTSSAPLERLGDLRLRAARHRDEPRWTP
jgi:hypothetical protein